LWVESLDVIEVAMVLKRDAMFLWMWEGEMGCGDRRKMAVMMG
jgi:hypothetical protein